MSGEHAARYWAAVAAIADCWVRDVSPIVLTRELPTPTLPPSSRQRGTVTAKAAHDRRISSADEADLRGDGGTGG